MKSLMKKVSGFIGNEEGQGLVEYALIITLIAIVVIVAVTILGKKASNIYTNVGLGLGPQ
jgi:pilus assembly protein Flp/PilA